ncbi:MAG TPA: copper resistance CopC family protein [Geobacteraceae bacterium]|nr:copper resistance CopC family protein [Geobacteraceae bacterium]
MKIKHQRNLVFGLFLAFLCSPPEAALAHAFPDHSDPRVGATVSAPPAMVRIWFDGDLEPAFSTVRVLDGSGKRVDKGDGHVDSSDHTLLEAGLTALHPGVYHVYWSVVAWDGHRTEGDYTFTVK